MPKPNVLLLVIDCLRGDYVNQSGLSRIPVIDKLRQAGCSFTNAFAHSTRTTPSFANILTGQLPFEHGVRNLYGEKLSSGVCTLPALLKSAGYNTYAEASGPLGPEVGLSSGFDEYHFRGKRDTIHSQFGQALIEKFQNNHFRSPWFLMLHIWALHKKRRIIPECDNPETSRTEYGRALASIDCYLQKLLHRLPKNTLVILTGDHGELIPQSHFHSRVMKFRKRFYDFRRKYRLTRLHPSIGLRYCAEGHGQALYDIFIHVPLVINGPGVNPGVCHTQVRHIDIAPTILDYAGMPIPSSISGESLIPAANGEGISDRIVYCETANRLEFDRSKALSALRVDNQYKYICALLDDSYKPELYNLRADPHERKNIIRSNCALSADFRARIEALNVNRPAPAEKMSEEERRVMFSRLKNLGYHD